RKAVSRLARAAHQDMPRPRQDVHPKAALTLVRGSDTLDHEALQVAHMVRNHPLATRSSAAGWRALLALLAFKAESAGKRVVAGDPACTSQACAGCGVLVHTGLSVRPAALPGRRTQPAPGPQRPQAYVLAPSSAFGDSPEYWRGRTENPWGFSPRGVSGCG